ncbi:MAG: hypothetical protein PWR27_1973 [Petroclostridium sp.]|jgi:hypothetical protein|uniref:DUF2905 domain-containing protein n=1 Tax=Petroclostridium xylanilyticum TaxID=1792311 RepID=UPI000B987DB4|nr:DUF2905 domain-containing protein [Petroclostridium xylanilyticum]MBZ4645532.1 hypothetical protein [Clostridia bacterium]MDK2811264.1 hypothetical protein [Petroclostridium sp.]
MFDISSSIGKMLITFGVIMIAVGIIFIFGSKIGIGRLPGDIAIRKGNFAFYFPIVTSILLSVILTIVLNIIKRFF